jgi:signal transduction histidine kinase
MRWRRRLGVRARAALAFGLVGLVVAVVVATSTFLLSRSYLLDQREAGAERQAFANARLVRSALRATDVDVADLLTTVRGATGSDVVVRYRQGWFTSSVAIGQDDIPTDLRRIVNGGSAGRQLQRTPSGGLQLVVGTPMAAVDGAYFEVFPLAELERTLALVRNVLIAVTLATATAAGLAGRVVAARVVRPLGPVTDAAEQIASGDLGTRLPETSDPDLSALTGSFNTMAAALQERVEQEIRFTSDVSHELRSPLAAMRAAVEILDRRREKMPDEVLATVEMLSARVESFEELVLDLLEISRLDAHAVNLDLEDLDAEQFLRNVIETSGAQGALVEVHPAGAHLIADRRRLAQALSNIVVNAERYAGGLRSAHAEAADGTFVVHLDDSGPGIALDERRAILQRFVRGRAGKQAGSSSGTGLGLALTSGHVALHGGTVDIDDAPGGGARFTITLPQSSDR